MAYHDRVNCTSNAPKNASVQILQYPRTSKPKRVSLFSCSALFQHASSYCSYSSCKVSDSIAVSVHQRKIPVLYLKPVGKDDAFFSVPSCSYQAYAVAATAMCGNRTSWDDGVFLSTPDVKSEGKGYMLYLHTVTCLQRYHAARLEMREILVGREF